jgi:general secretion pathway protein D
MVQNLTSPIAATADSIQLGVFNKGLNIPLGTGADLPTTNLKAIVEAAQMFGTTRTLSSPRLNAMNNQQAILSFVQNQVYFTLKVDQSSSTTATTTTTTGSSTAAVPTVTVNSTLNTVPIGIILTLQPSINLDTEEITMNIRPTITRTDGGVSDPAVAYILKQTNITLDSTVPVVEVKELDSILKIKNGQVMVVGGMMEDSSANKDSGFPGLMKLPLLGNLFKTVSKVNSTTQTVIFIKATIVPSNRINKKDKDLYNNFAIDEEVHI